MALALHLHAGNPDCRELSLNGAATSYVAGNNRRVYRCYRLRAIATGDISACLARFEDSQLAVKKPNAALRVGAAMLDNHEAVPGTTGRNLLNPFAKDGYHLQTSRSEQGSQMPASSQFRRGRCSLSIAN